MRKKDILELKRRLKKDDCTFTKMCGCYVDGNKNIVLNFKKTFLNLEEAELFKYLEIAKKVLSGTIGNNILELNFPINVDGINEKQYLLMELKKSKLKDDNLLENFYKSIIDSYDYTGNFLITIFHDSYDVITKTSDNSKIDESEEVYDYILCAICPVSLSKPGLSYFEDENEIKARLRDWVVEAPSLGFVFPAFIERSADVNSIMYYTKNAKDPHPELMEEALGCPSKQTATIQKETFQSIIKDSMDCDEDKADKLFMEIQENLNTLVEDYNSIYDDIDSEPIVLTKDAIQNILIESGIPEEATAKIEKSYIETFGDVPPLAEHLIDTKALQAKAQKKKEEQLERQVEMLQSKLEEVKQEVALDTENNLIEDSIDNVILEKSKENFPLELLQNAEEDYDKDENEDNEDNEVPESLVESNIITNGTTTDYDIILQVKPNKVPQIKSQIINGQKCIVIPIDKDEQTTINTLDYVME